MIDDRVRWPKWIGRVIAFILAGALWAIIWLMWTTIQKIF